MKKEELIENVAAEAGLSKKDSHAAVNAVFDTMAKALENGDDHIQLIGFGTFRVSERGARKGRNPQTGEAITIKAHKAITFKTGRKLREAINK